MAVALPLGFGRVLENTNRKSKSEVDRKENNKAYSHKQVTVVGIWGSTPLRVIKERKDWNVYPICFPSLLPCMGCAD